LVTTACKVSPVALSMMLAAAALPPLPATPAAAPVARPAPAPIPVFPAPYLPEAAFNNDIAAGNLGGVGPAGGSPGGGVTGSGPAASRPAGPMPEAPAPSGPSGYPPATAPGGPTPPPPNQPVTPVPEPDSVLVFLAALAMLSVASVRLRKVVPAGVRK
jgi:hypothetical protein